MGTLMDEKRWEVVALSFIDLNETRVVGNRGDFEESIFQILPKVHIIKNEKAETKSLLPSSKNNWFSNCTAISVGGNSMYALAVATDLLIFDDNSKFDKIEKQISFDYNIDFVASIRALIAVGLSSSEIVLIHPTTFEKLDTRTLESAEDAQKIVARNLEGRFFVSGKITQKEKVNICDINATNVEGQIYCFQSTCELNSTLDFSQTFEKSLLSNCVQTSVLKLCDEGSSTITAATFWMPKYFCIAQKAGCALSILQQTDGGPKKFSTIIESSLLKDLGISSKKGVFVKKIVRREGLIFVLLSTGSLEILFDDSLFPTEPLKLPITDGFVHDFTAILTGEEVKLWCIYGSRKDPLDSNFLGIFSGPSFLTNLVIQIPALSCIVSSSAGAHHHPEGKGVSNNSVVEVLSIKFNQQISDSDEPSSFIVSSSHGVKIFQVLESSCEITLQRLLGQGKFELANAFATKYSITIDVVRKARVQDLLKDLLLHPERTAEPLFKQMMDCLESIEDTDFVCKFCISHNNSLPRISWVKEVLSLGMKRVPPVANTEHGKKLLRLGKKFYTFQQVTPNGSVQDWHEFSNPNNSMFELCRRFLNNGQYEYCDCVWTRHSEEFMENVDLNALGTVFYTLFCQQLRSPESINLFTTVLADALQKCCSGPVSDVASKSTQNKLAGLMELVKKQIFSLERQNNWPHGAVKFVQTLISIFNNEELKYKGLIANERLSEPEWEIKLALCQKSSSMLKLTLEALQELAELRTSHSMRVSFEKFMQDDLFDVVNALFDELFVRDEIFSFVEKFLKRFAARKNLDLDQLYQKHIESVLQDLQFFVTSSIPYEERIITLVELISSTEIKLESVFQMVNHWPVPWCEALNMLVQRILSSRNILEDAEGNAKCQQLLQQIALVRKQVPFQCLLNKYRLTASKLTSTTGVMHALRRILRSKRLNTNAYDDCILLIKHTGKVDEDYVQMMKLRIDLHNEGAIEKIEESTNDIIPADLDKSVLKKIRSKCLMLIKSYEGEDNSAYSEVYLKIMAKLAKIVSQKIDSGRESEFLELRKVVPNLHDMNLLEESNYPFGVLDLMLNDLYNKPSEEIIKDCSRLSDISFHSLNEIIVAVLIACTTNYSYSTNSMINKLWDMLEKVTSISSWLRSPLLQDHVIFIIDFFILQNPTTSYDNQLILEKFIILLIQSFESSSSRFSELLSYHRIFISLREKEIPLEKEFLSIYKGIFGHEQKTISAIQRELQNLGENLIKYGENDLMITILNGTLVEYETLKVQSMEGNQGRYFEKVVQNVLNVKETLIEKSFHYRENEENPHIIKLVESLCDAGIFVNAFALRNRDKTKLIKKLLDIREHRLASEVALVFEYRQTDAWCSILKGFMSDRNVQNLKSLLSNLKNITELWVLPEFSAAWLQVSETFPAFKNLCPIPI